jgi:DNA-binding transcriptional LysR family regulator
MAKHPYDVLDLKSLRCFFAVAKHGSLTKAGIELDIAQAAVSQRVKALETQLGLKLYEVRGGHVRLTAAGERAHAFAVSLFDEIDEFAHALTHSPETGEVVLATHDEVLGYLLPGVVERFARAHPLARLRLLARPIKETLRLLKANDIDIGVLPSMELPNDLEFLPVARYPAYLLTSKGHPLARRARADFNSLLNEETMKRFPLIVAEAQLDGRLFKTAFARLNLPLVIGMEVGTFETLKQMVARGIGVAVVPGLCLAETDSLRIDAVEIPQHLGAESTYGIVLRRNKHRSPSLRSLVEIFTSSLGKV